MTQRDNGPTVQSMRIVLALASVLLLAGCGGGSGSTTAADLAGKAGCPHVSATSQLQPNEPRRAQRAECHGLTIITFASSNDRDTYVAMTKAADKAFGQDVAVVTGDTWAVMGSTSAVAKVKPALS